MSRITENDLQAVCDRINRTLGTPLTPYSKVVGGTPRPNGNAYHLSYAYGGASLHQMMPTGTGVRDVLGVGHVPKRELYEMMHAFLRGIDAAWVK